MVPFVLIFSMCVMVLAQGRPAHLPNPKLTPGATLNVTKEDLCDSKYRDLERSIPVSVKSQVFDMYGIRPDTPGGYNVDRLIPARLGGSGSIKNLWPQPLEGEWTYHMKNRLERRLYRLVCSGQLDLKKAQELIARDWVAAYQEYMTGADADRDSDSGS